jgi:hypothetical protein
MPTKQQTPKKILVDTYGFQPSETTNYMCTEFHIETKVREFLLDDGAICLHEFTPLLHEFFYNYLNNNNNGTETHLSYIHIKPTGDGIMSKHMAVFKGCSNKQEKIAENKDNVIKILDTFDLIYKLFLIKSDENVNMNIKTVKGYIKNSSNKYRLGTSFTTLVDSYLVYKNNVIPKIKKLFKIEEDNIQTSNEVQVNNSNTLVC